MKKKFIIIALSILLTIGILTPVGFKLFKKEAPKANEEISELQTAYKEKPTDGSNPRTHSALENIEIAAGTLFYNPHFKAIGEGHALTTMVIKNDQYTYSERFVDGESWISNVFTTSSFIKTATQRFYKNNKAYERTGKLLDEKSANWSTSEPNIYSFDYIKQNVGWYNNALCAYVINEDSLLSYEIIEDENYFYTLKVVLDTEISVSQSKRDVKRNSNALDYPLYSYVECIVSMDEDWTVRKVITHDIYDITVKMGVKLTAPVDSTMTEYFYYEDYSIDEPTKLYFEQYANKDLTNLGDTVKERVALDYIEESVLGLVLDGSTLDCNVRVNDLTLSGKVYLKFDINNVDLDLIVSFGNLFLKYDDILQISYLKYNYQFDSEFFSELIKVFNIDINSILDSFTSPDSSADTSGILSQIESFSLVKNENGEVLVSGELDLFGTPISLSISVLEDETGILLTSLNVTGNIDNFDFALNINPTNKSIREIDMVYVDLSDSSWIVGEISKLSDYPGYNININYSESDIEIDSTVHIDANNFISGSITFKYDSNEIKMFVDIRDDYFYLSYDEYKFKISRDNIESLASYITQMLPKNQSDIDLVGIVAKIYFVLDAIEVSNEGRIDLSLALSSIGDFLLDTIISIDNENESLIISSSEYGVAIKISEYTNELNDDFNEDDYYSLTEFVVNVEDLLKVLNEQNMDIDYFINKVNEISSYQSYNFKIDNIKYNGIKLSADIYADSNAILLNVFIGKDNSVIPVKLYLDLNTYTSFLNILGNTIKLSLNDLKDLVDSIDLSNIESISNAVKAEDIYLTLDILASLYDGIESSNGGFRVKLTLDKVKEVYISNLSQTVIDLFENIDGIDLSFDFDNLKITDNDGNSYITLLEYKNPVSCFEYDEESVINQSDIEFLISYVEGIIEYINDLKAKIEINDLRIQSDSLNVLLNGVIELKIVESNEEGVNDKITFKGNLYVELNDKYYYVALEYGLDEILHIIFSDEVTKEDDIYTINNKLNLEISRNEIIDVLLTVLDNIDEDSELGKYVGSFDGVNTVKSLLKKMGLFEDEEIEVKEVSIDPNMIINLVFSAFEYLDGIKINIDENNGLISIMHSILVDDNEVNIDVILNKVLVDELNEYNIILNRLQVLGFDISGSVNISKYLDNITVDTENSISLEGISDLGESLFNTIENKEFYIEGNLGISIGQLKNAVVGVDAQISTVDDEVTAYIHLAVPYVTLLVPLIGSRDKDGNSATNSYIYIVGNEIYMKKEYCKSSGLGSRKTYTMVTEYRKNTLEGFQANMMDNISWLLDFSSLISGLMKIDSSKEMNLVIDRILKSLDYSVENKQFDLVLDLENGLSDMFSGDMNLSIVYDEIIKEDKAYKFLSNLKVALKIFGALDVSADLSELSYDGTKNIDLDNVIPENIKSDTNYKYFNEG